MRPNRTQPNRAREEASLDRFELVDVLDAPALQSLMDDFYEVARIPMSVIDLDGAVIVGVGWQRICTGFHRVHPETCRQCIESDTRLTRGLRPGEYRLYRCPNNMWDVVTPIMIGDRHVGNVFSGQFFFDDETVDYDLFKVQAATYGFDQQEYLAALDAVPRLNRRQVERGVSFLVKLAGMMSQLGMRNLDLQAANAMLAEADRRKDEFIALLSHELRNPLAPIRYALPLLACEGLTEPGARAVAIVDRQLAYLTRLVDDLLDVARITRGKIHLRCEPVTVQAVVEAAVEAAAPAVAAGRHDLKLEVPDERIWLHADPPRLAQVLTNLLQNSAKYSPPGGSIVLRVVRDEDFAVIVVSDSGIGIPPESLPFVFEMFRQVERPDKPQGGLGIGLALTRWLVEMHGGSVAAYSEGVSRGAEFVVRLPVFAEPATSPPAGGASG